MWVKKTNYQIIVFIDPKGLEHSKGLDDEKIQFANIEIKKIEQKIQVNNPNLKLFSFIISVTEYQKLIKGSKKQTSKEEYKQNNVLFLEDENWPEELFHKIL